MSMVLTPLTFVLFSAWPVAIGTVSLFYCGKCPGFPMPFGSLSHLLQSQTFTYSTSVKISSGS